MRVFQLTYNRRNLVGDGCLEPGNAGLSRFGHALVEKLNERHLLIDLSHAGERTTREAIARSNGPVAISHTGCAALAALPRNKTDTELRELAAKGGVAGIYLMPFLRAKGQPTADDLIAHIEHAIKVCGEDHVGIGSDGTISPIDFNDEFRRKHAEDVADRRARGISAPGEEPDVYTFLPDLNTRRPPRHAGGPAGAPRARRRAHRQDPRRQFRPPVRRGLGPGLSGDRTRRLRVFRTACAGGRGRTNAAWLPRPRHGVTDAASSSGSRSRRRH